MEELAELLGYPDVGQVDKDDKASKEDPKGRRIIPNDVEGKKIPSVEPPLYKPKLPFSRPFYTKAQRKAFSKFKRYELHWGIFTE